MATAHITRDPAIMLGKPVVAGTRITVKAILEYIATGLTPTELCAEYPALTLDDVRAAIEFAIAAVRDQPLKRTG